MIRLYRAERQKAKVKRSPHIRQGRVPSCILVCHFSMYAHEQT